MVTFAVCGAAECRALSASQPVGLDRRGMGLRIVCLAEDADDLWRAFGSVGPKHFNRSESGIPINSDFGLSVIVNGTQHIGKETDMIIGDRLRALRGPKNFSQGDIEE